MMSLSDLVSWQLTTGNVDDCYTGQWLPGALSGPPGRTTAPLSNHVVRTKTLDDGAHLSSFQVSHSCGNEIFLRKKSPIYGLKNVLNITKNFEKYKQWKYEKYCNHMSRFLSSALYTLWPSDLCIQIIAYVRNIHFENHSSLQFNKLTGAQTVNKE